MTLDQLRARIHSTAPPSKTCAYTTPDRDDEEDYSACHPAFVPLKDIKKELKKQKETTVEKERRELNLLWSALCLLTDASMEIETILKLDTKKDFLSCNQHEKLSNLGSDIDQLLEDYEAGSFVNVE